MVKSIRYCIYLLLASLLPICQPLYGLEKLHKLTKVTTSIIIPCHYKHAVLLKEALQGYAKQTELPNEVIVSLSEIDKVAPEVLEGIRNGSWPFRLTLLTHKQPVSEGGNRNAASAVAKGDVLICSDADDLPHWQRVEIIKYFFENYRLDFLIHPFVFDSSQWVWLEPSVIKFSVPQYVNEGGPHANGAISIRKTLWNRMKWNVRFEKALDAEYNGAVYAVVPHRVLIDAPIYHYRNQLTSYDQD